MKLLVAAEGEYAEITFALMDNNVSEEQPRQHRS
jgi:hypothetical protein